MSANLLASVIDATPAPSAVRTADETLLHNALAKRLAESQAVIEHVQTNVPQDRLLRASTIAFNATPTDLVLSGGTNGSSFSQPLTRFALGQAATRVGFPGGYAADVMAERGDTGRKVVSDALTTLWRAEKAEKKILVRSVNDKIHGVLSDAFRRLDCRPGVDSFIAAVQRYGAVPYGGVVTDTRIAIRAVLPRIFRLNSGAWNDAVIIGAILRNSDFGAGKYSLALYLERVRCLNGMIGEMLFAQTHIGGRLDEADFYSERTHKLDSATMISATTDYVSALLSPAGVERTVGILQAAASQHLDLEKEINTVLKKAMTKEEIKGLTSALQSVNEDEMPLGPPTPYRMSNAISWLANNSADPDRALDLQRLAGNYLKPVAA